MADSAQGILAAIKSNIARAQDAKVKGTVAAIVPIPPQYIPEPAPPSPLGNAHALPTPVPATLYASSFPKISRTGPKVPLAVSTAARSPKGQPKPFARAEIRMTYSRALASRPRPTPQQRTTTRRNRYMDEVAFILLTNFDHQAISQTKKEFAENLEEGTDILHYRRMPMQGLELALPKYQVSTVSIQLRQMGYRLAPNYLPSNPMTRRRPGETESQGRERAAYCAHRALEKFANDPQANTAVSDWFARACDRIVAANPNVFTASAKEKWSCTMAKEALAKRAAEAATLDKSAPETNHNPTQDTSTDQAPALNTPTKPDAPEAARDPDTAPPAPDAPAGVATTLPQARDNHAPAGVATTLPQARDNSVPTAK